MGSLRAIVSPRRPLTFYYLRPKHSDTPQRHCGLGDCPRCSCCCCRCRPDSGPEVACRGHDQALLWQQRPLSAARRPTQPCNRHGTPSPQNDKNRGASGPRRRASGYFGARLTFRNIVRTVEREEEKQLTKYCSNKYPTATNMREGLTRLSISALSSPSASFWMRALATLLGPTHTLISQYPLGAKTADKMESSQLRPPNSGLQVQSVAGRHITPARHENAVLLGSCQSTYRQVPRFCHKGQSHNYTLVLGVGQ